MARKRNGGKLTSSAAGSSQHNIFVIDDSTPNDLIYAPTVDGEVKGHGLVPRDLSIYPPGMFAPPSEMPLIPRSEWDARIDEQERTKSSLEHVRMTGNNGQMIPSLDQNGQGYCWAYSTTMAVMLLRAVMNQPYVRFSAHAIGCKVKNFQNQGGWCGQSAKFHKDYGCPTVAYWAEKSMSRSNDNPQTWANAAKHKVTEDWVDVTTSLYDQNLTTDQLASCLLSNTPAAVDYNEWSHSICAIRWVRIEAGSYGPKILNSWTDGWGDRGMAVIRKGWTVDGSVGLRLTGASGD